MVYHNKVPSCVEPCRLQLSVEKEVYERVLSVFVPGPTSSYLRTQDVINQRDPDVSRFPRSHDTSFTKTCITRPVFTLGGYGEASQPTKGPNCETSCPVKSGHCTDTGRISDLTLGFAFRTPHHWVPPLGSATGLPH